MAQKLLRDISPEQRATLSAKLLRREPPGNLNTTLPIPCDFIAAVALLFDCSREEAQSIPLERLRREVSTAIGRAEWVSKLNGHGYRIESVAPVKQYRVQPSADEIVEARQVCRANPRILRSTLMRQMKIGSDKASHLIHLMRLEGIHKTKNRKSPPKNG